MMTEQLRQTPTDITHQGEGTREQDSIVGNPTSSLTMNMTTTTKTSLTTNSVYNNTKKKNNKRVTVSYPKTYPIHDKRAVKYLELALSCALQKTEEDESEKKILGEGADRDFAPSNNTITTLIGGVRPRHRNRGELGNNSFSSSSSTDGTDDDDYSESSGNGRNIENDDDGGHEHAERIRARNELAAAYLSSDSEGDDIDKVGVNATSTLTIGSAGGGGSNKVTTPSVLLPLPAEPATIEETINDSGFEGEKNTVIVAPTAILSPNRTDWDAASVCREYLQISTETSSSSPTNGTVVILLLRSGRFAGGVFSASKCLVHRACTRYTVRRGQGGTQSSLDSSKGHKAQSVGARLRRAGEVSLREDVKATLSEWKCHVDNATLILISCPKSMRKGLFEESALGVLDRKDGRIRPVPLTVGRPTFEEVCRVHSVLFSLSIRYMTADESGGKLGRHVGKAGSAKNGGLLEVGVNKRGATTAAAMVGNEEKETEGSAASAAGISEEHQRPPPPLTPLHEAASAGDLSTLMEQLALDGNEDATTHVDVDAGVGEYSMTALHYASSSTGENAHKCIAHLLLEAHANPCVVDSRNRPPYYLASTDKIREAFRLARGTLGEEAWDWDDGAKVGPPLTKELVQKKRDKASDKKRRQRQRQKEKKAAAKAAAVEEERQRKLAEEQRLAMETAKRIRDGLTPKTVKADNACDFCQKVSVGTRRSQMFSRLDYVYCSTDCVKRHQRELMANAAAARMQG